MSLAADLDDFLRERGNMPFDWGDHNCAHFVGAWVLRATGRDVLAVMSACAGPLAWRHWTKLHGGMPTIVTRGMGAQPLAAALAQLGDVVMFPGDITGGMLGVCAGRTAALLAAPGGIVHMPMTEALFAWPLHKVAA